MISISFFFIKFVWTEFFLTKISIKSNNFCQSIIINIFNKINNLQIIAIITNNLQIITN